MGRGLRPDFVAESVYGIDLDALAASGVHALCLDIDNTFVPWGKPADHRAKTWLDHVRERGFRIAFVSNNTTRRVDAFCADVAAQGVATAQKPRRRGFQRAMSLLAASPQETVVVGDQIWTDIWGGNRTGCRTILVRPIDRREFVGTRIARQFERVWLRVLARNHPPLPADGGESSGLPL